MTQDPAMVHLCDATVMGWRWPGYATLMAP